MKILYLIIGGAAQGVRKKILDKALFMRNAGAETTLLFIINEDLVPRFGTGSEAELLSVDQGRSAAVSRWWFFWRLSIFLSQRKVYQTLSQYLRGKDYDVILIRYPIADYFLLRLMKKYFRKYKIVFEHNTLESEELKLRSENSFWYKYFYLNERMFGRSVRSRAAGLISVTSQIAEWQARLAKGRIPSTTISNGIDVLRLKLKGRRGQTDEDTVNLLLLAGSEAPWHGVDVLLNSMIAYKGSTPVRCYIAGSVDPALARRAKDIEQVTLLHHQSHRELDALVEKCHVGIGSLALFRNNMSEGCTLKVREYWARGLPFVIGYDDTDLTNNESMKPFFLKVPVDIDKAVFDMTLVVAFTRNLMKIRDVNSKMRALALQQINYPVKVEQYLSFFEKLRSQPGSITK